jgi:isopentenyldiphosphate isomerase
VKIPIVNEQDEVIGEEERFTVHQKGLLHREAHVIFVTSDKKIIFQKRGLNKETYPGLLDWTVGGHVDSALDTYEQTATREAKEETGIDVSGQLILIEKLRSKSFDSSTNLINNRFTQIFGYLYKGDVKDLKLEDKEALGFEAYSLDQLENLSDEDKKKFIGKTISLESIDLYKKIIKKVNENQN